MDLKPRNKVAAARARAAAAAAGAAAALASSPKVASPPIASTSTLPPSPPTDESIQPLESGSPIQLASHVDNRRGQAPDGGERGDEVVALGTDAGGDGLQDVDANDDIEVGTEVRERGGEGQKVQRKARNEGRKRNAGRSEVEVEDREDEHGIHMEDQNIQQIGIEAQEIVQEDVGTDDESLPPLPELPPTSPPPQIDDELVRSNLKALQRLDHLAEQALVANRTYQEELVRKMEHLAEREKRLGELKILLEYMESPFEVEDESMTAGAGGRSEIKIVAEGTQQVGLPWFKHFHGQDLPPNRDGRIRDAYLAMIKWNAWSATERRQLKKEVEAQISRKQYLEGNDSSSSIDPTDPQSLAESIDWEAISLVTQYLQHDHPSINSSPWTKTELSQLYHLYTLNPNQSFDVLASSLGTNRTAADCLRQIRRRPYQENRVWSKEEDAKLIEGMRLWGENWQALARHVGRHANQCINRWTKTLDPSIRRGKWTEEEDETLRIAVASVGASWKDVAPLVRGRTDAQCRERWVNHLDPTVLAKNVQWTQVEEEELMRMRDEERLGWAEIARRFEGRRTDNHCMRRYKELKKKGEPSSATAAEGEDEGGKGERKKKRMRGKRGARKGKKKVKEVDKEVNSEDGDEDEDEDEEVEQVGRDEEGVSGPPKKRAKQGQQEPQEAQAVMGPKRLTRSKSSAI